MDRRPIALVALVAIGGCGEEEHDVRGADVVDAEGGAEVAGPFVPGPLEPFPELSPGHATSLVAPALTIVTYSEDDSAPGFAGFVRWLLSSHWYGSVTREFGAGAASVVDHIVLAGTAPPQATEDDTRNVLAQVASLQTSGESSAVKDRLYVVLYPAATIVTLRSGARSCQDFYGYHESFASGEGPIAFAVVPRCAGGAFGLDEWDLVKAACAHEVVEAVVNPYPSLTPSWLLSDGREPWAYMGGELADLCIDEFWREHDHLLPRMWSNERVRAGLLPCGPTTPDQDSNAFAVSTSPSEVVLLRPGETATVAVRGWSATTVPPWSVRLAAIVGNLGLRAELSGSEINNGETLFIRLAAAPGVAPNSRSVLALISGRDSDPEIRHIWPVVILVPDKVADDASELK